MDHNGRPLHARLERGAYCMDLATALDTSEIDAFYTINEDRLARRTAAFVERFPGRVLYAVKANPLPKVIRTVSAKGTNGFDIASIGEARLVQGNVPDAQCWFMNPVKARRDIERTFRELGIRNYVIDCEAELKKLLEVLPHNDPEIRIFARFNCVNSPAVFDLGSKFGASPAVAASLLRAINGSTRWTTGLTFHLGSQSPAAGPYLDAIREASAMIKETSPAPAALDIGGGFPGKYLNIASEPVSATLGKIAALLNSQQDLQNVEFLCEPGRALVYDSMSLFARIIVRNGQAVYCGAGIYSGLLSAVQFLKFPARCWRGDRLLSGDRLTDFVIFGPTCDANDRLAFPYSLPAELEEGDWLEFQHVGAYSESVRCSFNGFSVDRMIEVTDQELMIDERVIP
jgi:ornithine decarboxylase